MSNTPAAEAARRRTFAIISHPDAGKTTLTENLLLAGGAIRAAGAVRARGEQRRTRSDWMKIERERGISVSASAMTFDHAGLMYNLLDTPGHEDFSEDTYRTLTAADAAVMVLDAAKGIEPQTLKLFEVCRLRDIPIITFINKMDREAQDPFALLDEIASKLALDPAPLFWPAGSGARFKGMIDLRHDRFLPYQRQAASPAAPVAFRSNAIDSYLTPEEREEAGEGAMLVQEASKPFDPQSFREGHMTPVLFGSALRHFGVDQLLEAIGAYAPAPGMVAARRGDEETHVAPGDDEVSGFVFKIQANMDPGHRDRIAFLRLCSGRYARGMRMRHVRLDKEIRVADALTFMAADRSQAQEAYAGDIIGLHNHGTINIGDTFSEGENLTFTGVPNFAPEIFRRAVLKDPLRMKALQKGLSQLCEEGATQLFKPLRNNELILGAIGQLQFEVVAFRLQDEYSVQCVFEPINVAVARWVRLKDEKRLAEFRLKGYDNLAVDHAGELVYLAPTRINMGLTEERWPEIEFLTTRENLAA